MTEWIKIFALHWLSVIHLYNIITLINEWTAYAYMLHLIDWVFITLTNNSWNMHLTSLLCQPMLATTWAVPSFWAFCFFLLGTLHVFRGGLDMINPSPGFWLTQRAGDSISHTGLPFLLYFSAFLDQFCLLQWLKNHSVPFTLAHHQQTDMVV